MPGNSATCEAREKISTDLESLEFKKNFDILKTKSKNGNILLNINSHLFVLTNKLFIGRRSH